MDDLDLLGLLDLAEKLVRPEVQVHKVVKEAEDLPDHVDLVERQVVLENWDLQDLQDLVDPVDLLVFLVKLALLEKEDQMVELDQEDRLDLLEKLVKPVDQVLLDPQVLVDLPDRAE